MTSIVKSFALMLSVVACSCGDDLSGSALQLGADARADLADGRRPNACVAEECSAPDECRVVEDYGCMGKVAGMAIEVNPGTRLSWRTNIDGDCDAGTAEVLLMMELLAERGPFEDRITPGTYVIGADDVHRDTCGICIWISPNDVADEAHKCYFGSAGTLTLSEVGERLVGTIEDVEFGTIECATGEPLEDECASRIGTVEFDSDYYYTD